MIIKIYMFTPPCIAVLNDHKDLYFHAFMYLWYSMIIKIYISHAYMYLWYSMIITIFIFTPPCICDTRCVDAVLRLLGVFHDVIYGDEFVILNDHNHLYVHAYMYLWYSMIIKIYMFTHPCICGTQ